MIRTRYDWRATPFFVLLVAAARCASSSAPQRQGDSIVPAAASSTSIVPLEVRVSVAMEVRETYTLGEAMPSTIRVQNTSDHEVELPAVMGVPRYWLDLFVYGPDGREVTWRAHPPLIGGWKTKKNVPPGAAVSASVDLNGVFSIEKVGTYEVKAAFGSPPSLSERPYRIVTSPLYKFTVKETRR